jgi:hypothetical protein
VKEKDNIRGVVRAPLDEKAKMKNDNQILLEERSRLISVNKNLLPISVHFRT